MTSRFDPRRLARYRFTNRLQAAVLVLGIAGALVAIAHVLAGPSGIVVAIGLVVALLAFGPRARPALVARLFRARPLSRWHYPALFGDLETLAARAGLDQPPAVYLLPQPEPLAFSFGTPNDPAIGLSAGALEALDLRRLSTVLAHEIAHLTSGDVAILMLTEVMGRMVRLLALFGLVVAFFSALVDGRTIPAPALLALALLPLVTSLLQLALSRNREFDADQGAVELTGDAEGLARALQTIEMEQSLLWRRLLVPYRRGRVPRLLRTHPTTEERIARLGALTGAAPDAR
ncbi:MAG: M48 family metalloprotease [Alphaproteobacteria bacterium]|jgi:heat shock protein HtpX|nr:M48 family metalloprotease [Alphaproteobacteria bacterium]